MNMKQIIVVTDDRERYEKTFPARDFYITWCAFSIDDLIKKRANSNLILICMDHEDRNTIKRIGLYLRDICIEDEKVVYLYGNKDDVERMSSFIPSMFIKKKMFSFAQFDRMTDELLTNEVKPEEVKPICVILDDDMEYIEKLRVYLDSVFRVTVCRFDVKEINEIVLMADVVLLSVEGRMKLSEFMGLFQVLLAKKKAGKVNFYYLTPSNGEQSIINQRIENSAISFSKEMDVVRVAEFLKSHIKETGVKQNGQ